MPDENSAETAIKQAAEFYDKSEFEKVYDTLVKHKSETSNCELQWQLARACRDLATLASTTPQMKKDLTYEGLECAENAVKADDNNFASHKVSVWCFVLGVGFLPLLDVSCNCASR